jgi:hypothetical protein
MVLEYQKTTEWNILWKETCGKAMSQMRRQYKKGLSVVAEYKMRGEGSLGWEHLKAKY